MADGKPGVLIDPAVWQQYASIDPKHALDQKHESWNPIWGFPKFRTIDSDACLSDSVAIRYQNDEGYRPKNLSCNSGVLAPGYKVIPIVASIPKVAAASAP